MKNKLQQLINKLCPNGVEYKELGELLNEDCVFTITPPKKIAKNQYKNTGQFPIIDQGQNFIVGYINDIGTIINNGEYVIFGDHTETIKYVNFAFAQGADGIKILGTAPNNLIAKYLYYAMNNFYKKSGKYTRHFGLLKFCKIPIPPLEVQKEIVRILDKFTELKAELEAKLEAELEARQKQYEYYRINKLITERCFNGVEFRELGAVCDILDNLRKPVSKEKRNSGKYPYYGANGIQDYVEDYIFDGTYLLLGEDGSVINADKTPILNWVVGKIWVNNHAHILQEKSGIALLRFIYFWLSTCDVSGIVRGIPPKINQQNLRKIKIPIPSLEVQKEIVCILDKFDKLINDISEGLPTELAARRKQYEYYRNKLLTFKEA
ncbi:MAG: restriction endonuclease subunit S [Endomicrobium sp.]|jgi:type I restriction enzyme S subunit|nr:restriction endonuclease subunit S [Endomicrobium sp.]